MLSVWGVSPNNRRVLPGAARAIKFQPTVEEIVEIARPHLETEEAIISFGQGCEGEPLLAWRTIAGAIREIRKETDQEQSTLIPMPGCPTQ